MSLASFAGEFSLEFLGGFSILSIEPSLDFLIRFWSSEES